MRLDKYLCKALNITRSQAHELVKNGNIKVNEEIIKKKDYYINEDVNHIYYLDELLSYHEFVYIMMNKPQGVVSAVTDDKDQTVVDLIKERKDVFPVGRLDKDTEGLLILTNNGSLAHSLTSPKKKVVKKYFVEVEEVIKDEDILAFQKGIVINDKGEDYLTQPAKLERLSTNSAYVYITEGKFHQIKKMFYACRNEVTFLKRMAMGNINLDETLKPGEYRYLTNGEIIQLKQINN